VVLVDLFVELKDKVIVLGLGGNRVEVHGH
jgi:hypothetical protein